jgi:hypothetical protein
MQVKDVASGLVALLDARLTAVVKTCSGQATNDRDGVPTIGRIMERPHPIQLAVNSAWSNDPIP